MAVNTPTGIYITPEEYEIGAKNGINARNVYQRVYKYGWSVERAITTPLVYASQANEDWLKWKDTALANGISASAFRKRIYRGMSPDQAASKPLIHKGRSLKQ